MRTLILLLSAVLCAAAGYSKTFVVGNVIRVVDGDTIVVQLSSGSIKVRLYGIDAPEHNQQGGFESAMTLRSLVAGKQVSLEPVSQDRYAHGSQGVPRPRKRECRDGVPWRSLGVPALPQAIGPSVVSARGSRARPASRIVAGAQCDSAVDVPASHDGLLYPSVPVNAAGAFMRSNHEHTSVHRDEKHRVASLAVSNTLHENLPRRDKPDTASGQTLDSIEQQAGRLNQFRLS